MKKYLMVPIFLSFSLNAFSESENFISKSQQTSKLEELKGTWVSFAQLFTDTNGPAPLFLNHCSAEWTFDGDRVTHVTTYQSCVVVQNTKIIQNADGTFDEVTENVTCSPSYCEINGTGLYRGETETYPTLFCPKDYTGVAEKIKYTVLDNVWIRTVFYPSEGLVNYFYYRK